MLLGERPSLRIMEHEMRILKELGVEVSEWGDIVSLVSGKKLSPQKCKAGYFWVYAKGDNGKRRRLSVHRCVALAHIPNPEEKSDVNHKDGDKSNNRLSNLEWMTRLENMRHARSTGLYKKQNPEFLKMRNKKILEMLASGKTQKEVGLHFGLKQAHVGRISRGISTGIFKVPNPRKRKAR